MKCIDTNPWLEEVRLAYHASRAYEILNTVGRAAGTVGAALPREPGSDDEIPQAGCVVAQPPASQAGLGTGPAEPALGIPLDDLEREFADRMEP